MDAETKNYIDSLEAGNIPWKRMFTAYGTAGHYAELLPALEQITDADEWKKVFFKISDFEHQSTMFPPAPFVFIFLIRILEKKLEEKADDIVEKLIDQFTYYINICIEAEQMEHAPQLDHFSDLLDEQNLLPADYTEDDLMDVFENPEAVSDELFYSFYHYSLIVLSQIPDILDQYKKYTNQIQKLRDMMESVSFLVK
ncbi:MAG: hypothetical protein IKR11_00695 [Solobacterium sp.]|nr:hypothetical protein [Solobacterium sp.]